MNTPEKPCEESTNYKYQDCINEKIVSEIGCSPYWLKSSQREFPYCSEVDQVKQYLDTQFSVSFLTEKQIRVQLNCLKPCTFIEYQVK